MAEAVRLLVAGLPAEIVREIGLRLRGVAVTEFENAQQMGRAASQGDAKLVILSDTLPIDDSIYVARRALDANEKVRIAYCISMAQAEGALHALKTISVDRFFLSPVDIEEMLRELAKMCGVEVLAPQESHGDNIAAAVFDAWDRARAPTFKKIDALDDAAIALLDNSISADQKAAAERDAQRHRRLDRTIRVCKPAPASRARSPNDSRVIRSRRSTESRSPRSFSPCGRLSKALLRPRPGLLRAPQSWSLSPPRDSAPLEDALAGSWILVVDDDAAITRGLTTLLKRRGISVTALNDPLQFWTVLADLEPSLIMLDFEMPRISGTELCRAVRNDRRWSELPVIFLTGHTDQESIH